MDVKKNEFCLTENFLKNENEDQSESSLVEPQNIAESVKLLQRAHRLKVGAVAAAEQAAEAELAAAAVELLKRRLVKQGKLIEAEKSLKRQALWTSEEVRFFFDALKMYGKNFFEISRHIRLRVRSANVTMKTKEQVRLFYYRTWNMIKPCLSFDELVSPLAQELYGLINYSVFRQVYSDVKPFRWQPFPQMKKKHKEKLNELVNKGSVKIKIRGKNRIAVLRTPLCQTLKRLNFIETPRPLWQYPEVITLELVPRSSMSFARVQAAGSNPRVRVRVSVNRQLFDVLDFLKKKWMTAASLLRENVGLPASDFPQLAVFLPKDAKVEGAVTILSVARSGFRNVTLASHVDNLRQQKFKQDSGVGEEDCNAITAENGHGGGSESQPARFQVDVRSVVEELRSQDGMPLSSSRELKILVLYLALGCPETLSLEYEYRSASDLASTSAGENRHASNALWRLLRLCMHEYCKMKERRSRESDLSAAHARIEKLRAEVSNLKEQLKEAHKRTALTRCSRCEDEVSTGCSKTFRKPLPPGLMTPSFVDLTTMHNGAAGNALLVQEVKAVQACGRNRGRQAPAQRPIVVQRQLQVGGPVLVRQPVRSKPAINKLVSTLPALIPSPAAAAAAQTAGASGLLERAFEFVMEADDNETSFTALLQGIVQGEKESARIDNFADGTNILNTPLRPHIHGDNETSQWQSNSNDNSLSEFFDHSNSNSCNHDVTVNSHSRLKSPLRLFEDTNSRDSCQQAVDLELTSMLTENSTDYVEKFADLAKHIGASDMLSSGLTPRKDMLM